MVKVVIKKSDKEGKKLVAVFTRENGRTKKTYFGQAGAPDYTITKDKAQRKRYLDRHRARENWNNPESAGALSRWILWSGPSRQDNIRSFKSKFNLK